MGPLGVASGISHVIEAWAAERNLMERGVKINHYINSVSCLGIRNGLYVNPRLDFAANLFVNYELFFV